MTIFGGSEYVNNVCRIGQKSACCRYLVADRHGFHCAKLSPQLAAQIELRLPMMTAQANNCEGKPHGDVL